MTPPPRPSPVAAHSEVMTREEADVVIAAVRLELPMPVVRTKACECG